MPTIHPTAILEGEINLADDVTIGPHCILQGNITIGAGTNLISNVCINGNVTIGERTNLYPNAAIGFEPQDYKFAPGSPTAGVVIGDDCLIREHATVHAASNNETPTRVGNKCFLMVNSHVGHDTQVGNSVILVNNTALAGHCIVEDNATLSGGVLVHQHCRIGRLTMCSGGSTATVDIPPFCMLVERNELVSLNIVGLRRSGMHKDEINALKDTFVSVLKKNLPKTELIDALAERGKSSPAVQEMHDFVVAAKKPICQVGRTSRKSSSAHS